MINNDAIIIENLSKKYASFVALDEVSLSIKQNQTIVICGPSGSGKSTLIRCINGLEEFDAGKIVVNNNLVTNNPKQLLKLRKTVGMVFQQFNLFPHLTILENLTLAPIKVNKLSKQEAVKLAEHYLEKVKILEQKDKYPNKLSGGQQQRAAIARSLCMQPKIMLFDEPTSALDPEMIQEVLDVMIGLAHQGMTLVCVTHEMGFAKKVADSIIFMDEGKIIEQNNPKSFFENPKSSRAKEFLEKIISH